MDLVSKKHSMVIVQRCQNHRKTIEVNSGLKKNINHSIALKYWPSSWSNTSHMVAPVPTEASLPESMGGFHLPTHRQWVEAAVEATVKAGLQLQHDLLLICTLRSMSLPGVFANGLQCTVIYMQITCKCSPKRYLEILHNVVWPFWHIPDSSSSHCFEARLSNYLDLSQQQEKHCQRHDRP